MENKKEEFKLRINGILVPEEVINPFIEAIRKEEREETAKEIFDKLDNMEFDCPTCESEYGGKINLEWEDEYKALKLAFLPILKDGVSSEVS